MKNVGSLLALVAFSATFVSARALPALDSIAARIAYSDVAEINTREAKVVAIQDKKAKAVCSLTTSLYPY